MSSVRTHACLMDVLLYKLYTEKINIAIDETHVFACSNEVFKLSASSCVCFVEHLTTRFYGFTAHSQFCMSGVFFDILIVLSV